jgi:methylthioribose-1-phosphate isomerase
MRHFKVDFVVAGIAISLLFSNIFNFNFLQLFSGADQVAMNGDTANKIGTYALAISAHRHECPFFICTPISSINGRLTDGQGIRVEERPPEELTHWNGRKKMGNNP